MYTEFTLGADLVGDPDALAENAGCFAVTKIIS